MSGSPSKSGPQPSIVGGQEGPRAATEPKGNGSSQHTIVLVEFRDEVFARLASDLRGESGIRVTRAERMSDACLRCAGGGVDLLIVNVDRTDEAAWLRARQLHDQYPDVDLWVVTSWSSSVDSTLAKFIRASQLIYYADLWRLADEIRLRMVAHGGDGDARSGPESSRSAA